MKRECKKCKKTRSSGHFRKSKCHPAYKSWLGIMSFIDRGYNRRALAPKTQVSAQG